MLILESILKDKKNRESKLEFNYTKFRDMFLRGIPVSKIIPLNGFF